MRPPTLEFFTARKARGKFYQQSFDIAESGTAEAGTTESGTTECDSAESGTANLRIHHRVGHLFQTLHD